MSIAMKMVQLSLGFAPHTTGYLHVQTNPKWSYSADRTVKNAESEDFRESEEPHMLTGLQGFSPTSGI